MEVKESQPISKGEELKEKTKKMSKHLAEAMELWNDLVNKSKARKFRNKGEVQTIQEEEEGSDIEDNLKVDLQKEVMLPSKLETRDIRGVMVDRKSLTLPAVLLIGTPHQVVVQVLIDTGAEVDLIRPGLIPKPCFDQLVRDWC